jgi:cell division septum initiation protein DivIVA
VETSKRITEQELSEAKAEAEVLRQFKKKYEEALYGVLGTESADRERSLAERLRDHVDGLKRELAQRVGELDELRRDKALQRTSLLEETARVKEQGSLYMRLARTLAGAAREVLGLVAETEGVTAEEAQALCLKLSQHAGAVQGAAQQKAEEVAKLQKVIKEKDLDLDAIKKKLR